MWQAKEKKVLVRLLAEDRLTFSEMAVALNKECGTRYTRNAVISRANRCAYSKPAPRATAAQIIARKKAAAKAKSDRRRERRAMLRKEREAGRQKFKANCVSKTSAAYRRQFDPLPVMTRNELRDMLRQAVQNTAALS